MIKIDYEDMVNKIQRKIQKNGISVIKFPGAILTKFPRRGSCKGLLGLFTNGIAGTTDKGQIFYITARSDLKFFNNYFLIF